MDLSVFSHLRWNFVYQRPQHIMGRMAKEYRTFYFEEPKDIEIEEYQAHLEKSNRDESNEATYDYYLSEEGVTVIVPLMRKADFHNVPLLESIVRQAYADFNIEPDIFWYYTPMALAYTTFFHPKFVVYDCMDQLAAFKNAPRDLIELEKKLFQVADIVFTGGQSLYLAKKESHHSVHCFPSSIDKERFESAVEKLDDPRDQKNIPRPRVGYYGVVDERFDIELLRELAMTLPEWSFVIIGPVAKIDPDILPQAENIHYLGLKKYAELPRYLSNWEVAMMPFAINEATRYISPTKTPEYLAAGKKVVSTAVHDVVHPYEELGLVSIGRTSREFAAMIQAALQPDAHWAEQVRDYLQDFSWDHTCMQMKRLIEEKMAEKEWNIKK